MHLKQYGRSKQELKDIIIIKTIYNSNSNRVRLTFKETITTKFSLKYSIYHLLIKQLKNLFILDFM